MRRARLHPVSHSKTLPSPSGKVGEGREELSVEAERERQDGLGAQAKEGLLAGTWHGHAIGFLNQSCMSPFVPLSSLPRVYLREPAACASVLACDRALAVRAERRAVHHTGRQVWRLCYHREQK